MLEVDEWLHPVTKSLCKSHCCVAQWRVKEVLFGEVKSAFHYFQSHVSFDLSLPFQNGSLAWGLTFWCYATFMTWGTFCSFTTWPPVLSSRPSPWKSAALWGTAVRRRTLKSFISLLPFYLQVRVFSPVLLSWKIRLNVWVSFGKWKWNALLLKIPYAVV